MIDVKYLKVNQLKRFLQQHAIKLKGTKKKSELQQMVKKYLAARTIQLFFLKKNQNWCAICLEKLYTPMQLLKRHRYHTQCLILYINYIGKFQDTILKEPLTSPEISSIEQQCYAFDLSPIDINHQKIEKEAEKNEEETAVLQTIYSLLTEIENDKSMRNVQELELYFCYFFAINMTYSIYILQTVVEIKSKDDTLNFQKELNCYLQNLLKSFQLKSTLNEKELYNVKQFYKRNYFKVLRGNENAYLPPRALPTLIRRLADNNFGRLFLNAVQDTTPVSTAGAPRTRSRALRARQLSFTMQI